MKNVLIFRHQLFKVSEPFISQQAEHLRQFRPIYVGRRRFGCPPEGAQSFALEDIEGQRRFISKLWQALSRDPRSYVRLIASQRPVLIHAHFGVEGVYALPLAKKLKVPLITTFHGFDATIKTSKLLSSGSPSWVNYAFFRKRLAKEGDLFLCVSEYIRQRALDLGFPAERTYVHYIGIDTKAISQRNPKEEGPIILHVARLVEKKGTEYLIRAFAEVVREASEFKLVIVGDGPLKKDLASLVKKTGIQNSVTFLGARSHAEVIDLMHKAAVVIVPSVSAKNGDSEGLPMVLLEASALGVPLIGTNHSGIPEVITDGKNGYLVPEREISLLAARMYELITNDELRYRMGCEARRTVEVKFDIQKQTCRLEKLYSGLIK